MLTEYFGSLPEKTGKYYFGNFEEAVIYEKAGEYREWLYKRYVERFLADYEQCLWDLKRLELIKLIDETIDYNIWNW